MEKELIKAAGGSFYRLYCAMRKLATDDGPGRYKVDRKALMEELTNGNEKVPGP